MRCFLVLFLSFLVVSSGRSDPVPLGAGPPVAVKKKAPAKKAPPLVFVTDPTHVDEDCKAALAFLSKTPVDIQPFLRFFSFAATPEEYLHGQVTYFRVLINKVSTAVPYVPVYEVPGRGGRLLAVDLRDPKWNAAAFSTVARRDQFFREPHVDHFLAEGLRRIIGIQQDPNTFHVEAIVPGPWFMREIMDADRSPAYYDLLYANERFGAGTGNPVPAVTATALLDPKKDPGPEPVKPQERPWPGGAWTGDDADQGKVFPPGAFQYIPKAEMQAWEKAHAEWLQKKEAFAKDVKLVPDLVKNQKIVAGAKKDFPADVNDWNKKWGIDVLEQFLKDQKIFILNGEVVAGAVSDRERGSYVAYHDRIITFLQTSTGVAMRTYDSLKTTADKNFANIPKESAIGDVQFDAGELLVNLPNGLQAALLINGEGKRVDFADSRVARNTLDHFDVVVKTHFSCIVCHGAQYGILAPSNEKIKEAIKRGNQLLAKNEDDQEILNTFYSEITHKIEGWRTPYRFALQKITASPKEPRGWDGNKLARETLVFRDWYDAPVGLEQAAAELGVPKLAVVLVCLSEGSIDAGNLVLKERIPREVWDNDLYPKLALILAAYRSYENPDPFFAFFFPELIRQTQEQIDQKKVK